MHYEKTIRWPEHVHRKKRDSISYQIAYRKAYWRAFFSYGHLLPLILFIVVILAPIIGVCGVAAIDCLHRHHVFWMSFQLALIVALTITIIALLAKIIIPELADCRCVADEAGTKARDEARSAVTGSSSPTSVAGGAIGIAVEPVDEDVIDEYVFGAGSPGGTFGTCQIEY